MRDDFPPIYAMNTEYLSPIIELPRPATVTITGFICPECNKQRTINEFYYGDDGVVSCTICRADELK